MWSSLFLVLFTFVVSCLYEIYSVNVTFIPTPIQINIADLPAPIITPYIDRFTAVPVPLDPHISVPNGFSIKLFMSGLQEPRILIYTPGSDILVSEFDANRISCLLDTDKDGFPDERITFADATNGLNGPSGMAFVNGSFYVANREEIRRYEWDPNNCYISGNGTVVMTYRETYHRRRTIAIPPSADKIYLSVGSDSDHGPEHPPLATVQQLNIDGSNARTFASGIRNPSDITIHPITGDFYVICNERNELGDELVPDFFTRIQQDDFFGWPYAYLTPNLVDPMRCLPNGTSEQPDLVTRTKTPDVLFPAHSSPISVVFYTGKQFPDRYRNGAFVTLHGSQGRAEAVGYTVVFVPFDSATNRPMGYYENFVTGFLVNSSVPTAFGRPAGLLVLKDGSLIFTDDNGDNRIYQVQYNNAYFHSLTSMALIIAYNGFAIFLIL